MGTAWRPRRDRKPAPTDLRFAYSDRDSARRVRRFKSSMDFERSSPHSVIVPSPPRSGHWIANRSTRFTSRALYHGGASPARLDATPIPTMTDPQGTYTPASGSSSHSRQGTRRFRLGVALLACRRRGPGHRDPYGMNWKYVPDLRPDTANAYYSSSAPPTPGRTFLCVLDSLETTPRFSHQPTRYWSSELHRGSFDPRAIVVHSAADEPGHLVWELPWVRSTETDTTRPRDAAT